MTAGITSTQAIGLTNMTQRHPGPSVSTPPSRIPAAEARPATAAHTPECGLAILGAGERGGERREGGRKHEGGTKALRRAGRR